MLTFAADARNVRLGLAADGFNPFANMAIPYSMWPVLLMTYNLPLWLFMKEPYLMLTLLIPGPSSPSKDIDVFLRPLVDELKELWSEGIVEQDACNGNNSDCELLCYGLLMIFSLGAVYQDGVANKPSLSQEQKI